MPFCGTCGKEHNPGENFCGGCGAPLKTGDQPFPQTGIPPPPPPPALVPPLPVPLSPVQGSQGALVPKPKIPVAALIGIVALLVAAAYFIGIPVLTGGTMGGTGLPHPVPTTPATVLPTPRPTVATTTVVPTTATPLITQEARYEETYEQVYASNKTYRYGEKITFPYPLTRPPLYVKFTITPVMENRTKIADIGLTTEHEVYAVYPSTNAWFEVRVLDAAAGTEIDKRGFGAGKGYSVFTKQEFMVRTSGDYVLEMSGSDVTVNVTILIGTS